MYLHGHGRSQGGWGGAMTSIENYAKKTTKFSFLFCDYNVKNFGAYNTPLEMCFQYLSNNILLKTPKFHKF